MYWLIYHHTFYLYVKKDATHILLLVHCCKLLNGYTITKWPRLWYLGILLSYPIDQHAYPHWNSKFAVYCCIDIFFPFIKLFTKFLSQYGRCKYCSKFENIIAFLVHIIYCLTLFVFYNNISKFIYDFTINTLRCMTQPKSYIPNVLKHISHDVKENLNPKHLFTHVY